MTFIDQLMHRADFSVLGGYGHDSVHSGTMNPLDYVGCMHILRFDQTLQNEIARKASVMASYTGAK